MHRRGLSPMVRTMCTSAPVRRRKTMKVKSNRPIINQQRERNEILQKESIEAKKDFRIVGATILHRYPVITKDPEQWEEEMLELQDKLSGLRKEWLLNQIRGTDADIIPDIDPSYEEILESLPFEPAPRVTEADESNDRKSLDRRLQDSLFLIVKRNRSSNSWQFPQGRWRPQETLREVSERVIDRAVGKVNRYFISNSPQGHYVYKYPAELQQKRDSFGAKVFFYRAQLIAGNVKLETKLYTDYAWIARDEVEEYFDPETAEYMKYLLPD